MSTSCRQLFLYSCSGGEGDIFFLHFLCFFSIKVVSAATGHIGMKFHHILSVHLVERHFHKNFDNNFLITKDLVYFFTLYFWKLKFLSHFSHQLLISATLNFNFLAVCMPYDGSIFGQICQEPPVYLGLSLFSIYCDWKREYY